MGLLFEGRMLIKKFFHVICYVVYQIYHFSNKYRTIASYARSLIHYP